MNFRDWWEKNADRYFDQAGGNPYDAAKDAWEFAQEQGLADVANLWTVKDLIRHLQDKLPKVED